MRKLSWVWGLAALGAFALVGCRDKTKSEAKSAEVSKVARAEAANASSDADFALQMRDYARAEKSLAHAVELDPEVMVYWVNLGVARRKLENREGARKAYEKAVGICEAQRRKDPKDSMAVIAQLRLLVLMNKSEDARKLLEKVHKEQPNDREIEAFWKNKQLDAMLTDPMIKQFML